LNNCLSKGPDCCRCCQAHRQSPSPHHLRKRTRSQGPLLRRHYPASTVIRPRPTPAMAAAFRDVEAATLALDGSPPITRTTFPACRAHYPGGSSGCACRLLPRSYSLPQMAGGSASALSLSRPARAIAAPFPNDPNLATVQANFRSSAGKAPPASRHFGVAGSAKLTSRRRNVRLGRLP
jgi:hypothetical protein